MIVVGVVGYLLITLSITSEVMNEFMIKLTNNAITGGDVEFIKWNIVNRITLMSTTVWNLIILSIITLKLFKSRASDYLKSK